MSSRTSAPQRTIIIFVILTIVNLTNAQNSTQSYREAFETYTTLDIQSASECLVNLTRNSLGKRKLVTILNCNITREPGYSIMANAMKSLHSYAIEHLISYEITNGTRNSFRSFEKCVQNCHASKEAKKVYKRYYQTLKKTDIYLVFIDSPQVFKDNFKKIEEMLPYNVSAEYYLFYATLPRSTARQVAEKVLRIAYNHTKYYSKILVPRTRDRFELYTYNLYANEAKYCASQPFLTMLSTCERGVFSPNVFATKVNYKQLNCTFRAVVMLYPPFVITPDDGLEMLILKEVGSRLNVTFEIDFNNISVTWGVRQGNGSWTGLLDRVHRDPLKIGVGCVAMREDRLLDFEYSLNYFSETMLWVVPASARVAEWKLILIIFTWSAWLVLFLILLLIGAMLCGASNLELFVKTSEDVLHDRKLVHIGTAILLSLQLTISLASPFQPRALASRFVFITYAVFIILVNCMYQSSLINVLTRPQYQDQISSFDEIVESDMPIEGISDFKESFATSESSRGAAIYNRFTAQPENAGMVHSLNLAASGKAITVLGEFYTKYKIGTPLVTNHDGSSKIFIVSDEVVYVETIRMIFAKNFVIKEQMNDIIARLVSAGIIKTWTNYYMYLYEDRDENEDANRGVDDGPQKGNSGGTVLTLRHFQGAFYLLSFGTAFGGGIFILEVLIFKIVQRRKKYLNN